MKRKVKSNTMALRIERILRHAIYYLREEAAKAPTVKERGFLRNAARILNDVYREF